VLKAHKLMLENSREAISSPHQKALMSAKQSFRAALVKLNLDKSEVKQEFAYGTYTTDSLIQLYKSGRKIAWPLIGLGTVSDVIERIKSGKIEGMEESMLSVSDEDLATAMNVLSLRCRKLNGICQAGIQHILCTLRLGPWAPPWWFSRIFLRKKKVEPVHEEDGMDLGTNAFLDRFDAGLKAFWQERTDGLTAFCDEKERAVKHVVFIVVFVEFLLFSVAQEIRTMILFVDYLRETKETTTSHFIWPKPSAFIKGIKGAFHGWDVPGFGPVTPESPLRRCRYTGSPLPKQPSDGKASKNPFKT
jgi:hypothetical protein